MLFPDYFCDHLNIAKEMVRKGELNVFPFAYHKTTGFVECNENGSHSQLNPLFIISESSGNNYGFECTENLYKDQLYMHCSNDLDGEIKSGIRLFCPLFLASLKKKEEPFIIAHMAQTIDGKVCTNNGDSKWIGNQENLKHAHRVRAMVDGVLVGGNTVSNDLPRLNVRLVKGANPVRLLLSNTFSDFEKLPLVPGAETYLLRRKDNPIGVLSSPVTKVIYYEGNTQKERIEDLLRKLKQNGMHSILLEGGTSTVTSFYSENKIDWLQLHFAPLIFGSGKSFVQLSEISSVAEGRELKNVFYNQVGDGMMITGELS